MKKLLIFFLSIFLFTTVYSQEVIFKNVRSADSVKYLIENTKAGGAPVRLVLKNENDSVVFYLSSIGDFSIDSDVEITGSFHVPDLIWGNNDSAFIQFQRIGDTSGQIAMIPWAKEGGTENRLVFQGYKGAGTYDGGKFEVYTDGHIRLEAYDTLIFYTNSVTGKILLASDNIEIIGSATITESGQIASESDTAINAAAAHAYISANTLNWPDTLGQLSTDYDLDTLTASVYDSLARHTDTAQSHNTRINNNVTDIISLSFSQGVSWDSDADTYSRLGSLQGIATSTSAGDDYLPIQSDMKCCALLDDGRVNYYIDLEDPIMKDGTTVTITGTTDATTAYKLEDSGADFVTDGIAAGQFVRNTTDDTYSIITAVDDLNTLSLERDIIISGEDYDVGTANFGGADGQIMVEIGKFYYNHTLVGTLNSWYISKYDLAGFELHPAFWKDGQEVNYRYYSAFEGSMWDVGTGAMTAKADIATDLYASGDKMCSVAGTWPKTNETRAEYRSMSAERGPGFRQLDYCLHSAVQLLYLVEYADFNSQAMIGMGRTELSGGTWTADSYIGMTGLSIADGNGTNSVSNGAALGYLTDYMCYRGIENWYGDVYKCVDGITVDGRWTGVEAAMPMYWTNNSAYFADEGSENMRHLCDASYIGTNAGYITNIENTGFGFIPSAVSGGSSTTYLTDYYYQYSESGRDYWRVFWVSDAAANGSRAGGLAVYVLNASTTAYVNASGRLCF